MKIRTSIKAVITQNDQVLFIKKQDENGFYYLLPGGGQEHGESMTQALKRECKEEVMVDIEIGEVLFVRDYIEKNHASRRKNSDFHQVEVMFACTISDNQIPQNGTNPDSGQVGVEWIAINEMSTHRIHPRPLTTQLAKDNTNPKIYLGDVN